MPFNPLNHIVNRSTSQYSVRTNGKGPCIFIDTPHGECRLGNESGHWCDTIVNPLAKKLSELFENAGFKVVTLNNKTPRWDFDANRQPARDEPYRRKLRSLLGWHKPWLFIDLHSFWKDDPAWKKYDLVLLKPSTHPRPELYADLTRAFEQEGLVVANFTKDGVVDIVSTSAGIVPQCFLLEINEKWVGKESELAEKLTRAVAGCSEYYSAAVHPAQRDAMIPARGTSISFEDIRVGDLIEAVGPGYRAHGVVLFKGAHPQNVWHAPAHDRSVWAYWYKTEEEALEAAKTIRSDYNFAPDDELDGERFKFIERNIKLGTSVRRFVDDINVKQSYSAAIHSAQRNALRPLSLSKQIVLTIKPGQRKEQDKYYFRGHDAVKKAKLKYDELSSIGENRGKQAEFAFRIPPSISIKLVSEIGAPANPIIPSDFDIALQKQIADIEKLRGKVFTSEERRYFETAYSDVRDFCCMLQRPAKYSAAVHSATTVAGTAEVFASAIHPRQRTAARTIIDARAFDKLYRKSPIPKAAVMFLDKDDCIQVNLNWPTGHERIGHKAMYRITTIADETNTKLVTFTNADEDDEPYTYEEQLNFLLKHRFVKNEEDSLFYYDPYQAYSAAVHSATPVAGTAAAFAAAIHERQKEALVPMRHYWTRADYMASKCTHEQYYEQFVTDEIIETLGLEFGFDRIRNSKDEHFNDIPLAKWDNLPYTDEMKHELKKRGDTLSTAGIVCIYKAAARLIRDGQIETYSAAIHTRQRDAAIPENIHCPRGYVKWHDLDPKGGELVRVVDPDDRKNSWYMVITRLDYTHDLFNELGPNIYMNVIPGVDIFELMPFKGKNGLETAVEHFEKGVEREEPIICGKGWCFKFLGYFGAKTYSAAIHSAQREAASKIYSESDYPTRSEVPVIWDTIGWPGTISVFYKINPNYDKTTYEKVCQSKFKDLPADFQELVREAIMSRDLKTIIYELVPVGDPTMRFREVFGLDKDKYSAAIHIRQRDAASNVVGWRDLRVGDLVETIGYGTTHYKPTAVDKDDDWYGVVIDIGPRPNLDGDNQYPPGVVWAIWHGHNVKTSTPEEAKTDYILWVKTGSKIRNCSAVGDTENAAEKIRYRIIERNVEGVTGYSAAVHVKGIDPIAPNTVGCSELARKLKLTSLRVAPLTIPTTNENYSAAVHIKQRGAAAAFPEIATYSDLRPGDLVESIDASSKLHRYGIITGIGQDAMAAQEGSPRGGPGYVYMFTFPRRWDEDMILPENLRNLFFMTPVKYLSQDICGSPGMFTTDLPRFKIIKRGLKPEGLKLTPDGKGFVLKHYKKYSAAVHTKQREAAFPYSNKDETGISWQNFQNAFPGLQLHNDIHFMRVSCTNCDGPLRAFGETTDDSGWTWFSFRCTKCDRIFESGNFKKTFPFPFPELRRYLLGTGTPLSEKAKGVLSKKYNKPGEMKFFYAGCAHCGGDAETRFKADGTLRWYCNCRTEYTDDDQGVDHEINVQEPMVHIALTPGTEDLELAVEKYLNDGQAYSSPSKVKVTTVGKKILKDYQGMNREAGKAFGFTPLPAEDEVFVARGLSEKERKATIKHEAVEARLMKNGSSYWPAHQRALRAEKEDKPVQEYSAAIHTAQRAAATPTTEPYGPGDLIKSDYKHPTGAGPWYGILLGKGDTETSMTGIFYKDSYTANDITKTLKWSYDGLTQKYFKIPPVIDTIGANVNPERDTVEVVERHFIPYYSLTPGSPWPAIDWVKLERSISMNKNNDQHKFSAAIHDRQKDAAKPPDVDKNIVRWLIGLSNGTRIKLKLKNWSYPKNLTVVNIQAAGNIGNTDFCDIIFADKDDRRYRFTFYNDGSMKPPHNEFDWVKKR